MNREQEKYLKKLHGWCDRAQTHCENEIPADGVKLYLAYTPSVFWEDDRGMALVGQLFHVMLGFNVTVGLKNYREARDRMSVVWGNLVWHMSMLGSYHPDCVGEIEHDTMKAVAALGRWAVKRLLAVTS